jgi:hypothetical protein
MEENDCCRQNNDSNTSPDYAMEPRRDILPAGDQHQHGIQWSKLHPNIADWPWNQIWRQATDLGLLNKISPIQFKILHRILAASSSMHKWGLQKQSECYICASRRGTAIDNCMSVCTDVVTPTTDQKKVHKVSFPIHY